MIAEVIINGVDYSKHVVTPINLAFLLDESLDEGALILKSVPVKTFKPLTPIQITFRQRPYDSKPLNMYFCVASCKSTEYPILSGYYNMTLTVIEETKRLERVTCSALTFTNAKGTTYADDTFVQPGKEAIDPILANNSWEMIRFAVFNDYVPETWAVGDTKDIKTISGSTVTARLVDMQNKRYLYPGTSGKGSKLTFMFVRNLYMPNLNRGEWNAQWNTSDTNVGGYEASYAKNTVIASIEDNMPDEFINFVSDVNVMASVGGAGATEVQATQAKLFLPSEIEINKDSTSALTAEAPLGLFNYWTNHNLGKTSDDKFWTRSADPNYVTCVMAKYQYKFGSAYPSDTYGFRPCFAI